MRLLAFVLPALLLGGCASPAMPHSGVDAPEGREAPLRVGRLEILRAEGVPEAGADAFASLRLDVRAASEGPGIPLPGLIVRVEGPSGAWRAHRAPEEAAANGSAADAFRILGREETRGDLLAPGESLALLVGLPKPLPAGDRVRVSAVPALGLGASADVVLGGPG